MQKQIEKLLTLVRDDEQILAVFLFGSAARNENGKNSDVDICLVIDSCLYASVDFFQKRLEYLKLFEMDIQVFQNLPIYIRKRIIKEGQLLFSRDEDRLYEVVFTTIREFSDFEHIYREYLQEVESGG